MATYRIEWKRSAEKELRRLPKAVVPRIVAKVTELADDPHPPGSRKLYGASHTYRIRVGNYRIVYSVQGDILTIQIVRVGHRRDIYRSSP